MNPGDLKTKPAPTVCDWWLLAESIDDHLDEGGCDRSVAKRLRSRVWKLGEERDRARASRELYLIELHRAEDQRDVWMRAAETARVEVERLRREHEPTDVEARADLEAMGVDVDAEREKFVKHLDVLQDRAEAYVALDRAGVPDCVPRTLPLRIDLLVKERDTASAERDALARELHTTLRAAGWAPMRGSVLPVVLATLSVAKGEAP